MNQKEQRAEYNRGFQDALRKCGYNDGAINTQGYFIVFRLTFREFSDAYADGYTDGSAYMGRFDDLLPANV
jgi:hypothetical protein